MRIGEVPVVFVDPERQPGQHGRVDFGRVLVPLLLRVVLEDLGSML
jgi:hypothetical protein